MEQLHIPQGISDDLWERLKPLLPGQEGQWGGLAEDNRRFLRGVFWVLRTGAAWRDLPPVYGKWNTVYQRFKRWRDNHTWERVLEQLLDAPGFEWLLGDMAYAPSSTHEGETDDDKGSHDMALEGEDPRYPWPWLRMICRSESLLRQIPRFFSQGDSL